MVEYLCLYVQIYCFSIYSLIISVGSTPQAIKKGRLRLSLSCQIAKVDDGLFYDENGDLITGVFKETYPNGILKAERTDIWYIFDESGKLVSSKYYR
jgi:hypothetical protein